MGRLVIRSCLTLLCVINFKLGFSQNSSHIFFTYAFRWALSYLMSFFFTNFINSPLSIIKKFIFSSIFWLIFYPIWNSKQAILHFFPFVISRHVSKYWILRASPWGLTTHFTITTLTKKAFNIVLVATTLF